jgi:hypothetical protein
MKYSDADLDALFADPRFQERMFQFIKENMQLKVRSWGLEYGGVEIKLLGVSDNPRDDAPTLLRAQT